MHTGEHAALERPSRTVLCPQCGGYNKAMHDRRVAHTAAWVRRHNVPKSSLKFVTVEVERNVKEELEGYAESYQFLTGGRGAYDKALRRLRYRDPSLEYVGIVAARPTDGLAHFHLLIVSSLSSDKLEEAVHVAGLDVDVQGSKDPTDSADDFAASAVHYLFKNAVRAAIVEGSFRFTASRGSGLGYHSKAARADRKAYVQRQRERRQRPSGQSVEQSSEEQVEQSVEGAASRLRGSIATNNENQKAEGEGMGDIGQKAEGEGVVEASEAKRPPPIRGSGATCSTEEQVETEVQAMLEGRQGSMVWVPGVGTARLIHWQRYPRCTVHVQASNVSRLVHWRDLEVEEAPHLIVETASQNRTADMSTDMSQQADHSQPDERSAYNKLHDRLSPRYSRVTIDNRTTIEDHQTGEKWVEGTRGYPHRPNQS